MLSQSFNSCHTPTLTSHFHPKNSESRSADRKFGGSVTRAHFLHFVITVLTLRPSFFVLAAKRMGKNKMTCTVRLGGVDV